MSLETPPSPREDFLEYTTLLISPYLEEKMNQAKDTDVIFGKITGKIDSARGVIPFKIVFDTNKDNLKSVVENLFREKIETIEFNLSSTFETLAAEINIAPESEKDKSVDERDAVGGSRDLI